MVALRKLLKVVVILFLLFALLVLTNVISTSYLDEHLTDFNPENYYRTIFGLAAGLLLLQLLFFYLDALAMKRERNALNSRINELKATLYDRKTSEIRDTRLTQPDSATKPDPTSKPDPIFPPDTLQ